MKFADAEAGLFSVKCFIAAMLAYYIALRIGLTRPFWAVTTTYIVAQPLAGAVLSKAVFRLIGTLLGATAAVVLVPSFVNQPIVLSGALALWLGVCLYMSLLDRTPRAYIFLLAGYTASIIGFPSVETPGAIFDIAIVRVQEIVIGIMCGSLLHGVVAPRTVSARLIARIDAILSDAERWSRLSLAGARDAMLDRERRRLAIDLAELDQLSIHLPFDTARLLPRVRTIRALQDQLSMLLPLTSAVEDRLAELRHCPGGMAGDIAALAEQARSWLEQGVADPDRDATAGALIDATRALEAAADTETPGWRDLLRLNLLSRLADLIAMHRDCRALRDQIRSPSPRALSPHVATLLAATSGRTLHRDRGLALRAALGTFATIAIGCAFWIGAAWPDGAGAVLIAGVCCALFGNFDNPGPVIFIFLLGSIIGNAVAIFYAYVLIPRATDFVTLAALLAPALLLAGAVLARPKLSLLALGALLSFINIVGFGDRYAPNFAAFLNGAIAETIGVGFAVVTVGLFQTIGTEQSIGRLARAGWRDVARRADGRSRDTARWSGRMLDRIGLLLPRCAALADPGKPLLDALRDMRTGVVAGQLVQIGETAPAAEKAAIGAALAGVSRHYLGLDPVHPSYPAPPDDALLADIDHGVDMLAGDPLPARRREGLVLLTSLRRNLFPAAPPYRPPALTEALS